ncbi:MAG: (Fe-S)-binding protein [ANME-2 cluster archaeon]|nr:(Fe-S)-binding protein [ANME-2 cluster archaeon]
MTSAMEIYQLLPKTNCKECGESTCMAFGVALLSGNRKFTECPPLMKEEKYIDSKQKLEEILKPLEGAHETGLIIHDELCSGCGNCVVACPVDVANDPHSSGRGFGPSNDKVIFRVVDGKVKAANIKECRRFGKDKILCRACIDPCPTEAIEFV